MVIYMLTGEEAITAITAGRTVYDAGRILGGYPLIVSRGPTPQPSGTEAAGPTVAADAHSAPRCDTELDVGRIVFVTCHSRSRDKASVAAIVEADLRAAAETALAAGKPFIISISYKSGEEGPGIKSVGGYEMLTRDEAAQRDNPMLPPGRRPMDAATVFRSRNNGAIAPSPAN
jgi:hypothetical protein